MQLIFKHPCKVIKNIYDADVSHIRSGQIQIILQCSIVRVLIQLN